MKQDDRLLAEAYIKIHTIKESSTQHMSLSDIADGIEASAHRFAGLLPRDIDIPAIRARLEHIYHEMADLAQQAEDGDLPLPADYKFPAEGTPAISQQSVQV